MTRAKLTLLITLTSIAAGTAQAQSVFLDRGEKSGLLSMGYSHGRDAHGVIGGFGFSPNGVVDLIVQANRHSLDDDQTTSGLASGVRLFLLKPELERNMQMSVGFAYGFGSISSTRYDGFSAACRLYLGVSEEKKAYAYLGISYTSLEIGTHRSGRTRNSNDTSMPVEFGLAFSISESFVGDFAMIHANSQASVSVGLGILH